MDSHKGRKEGIEEAKKEGIQERKEVETGKERRKPRKKAKKERSQGGRKGSKEEVSDLFCSIHANRHIPYIPH